MLTWHENSSKKKRNPQTQVVAALNKQAHDARGVKAPTSNVTNGSANKPKQPARPAPRPHPQPVAPSWVSVKGCGFANRFSDLKDLSQFEVSHFAPDPIVKVQGLLVERSKEPVEVIIGLNSIKFGLMFVADTKKTPNWAPVSHYQTYCTGDGNCLTLMFRSDDGWDYSYELILKNEADMRLLVQTLERLRKERKMGGLVASPAPRAATQRVIEPATKAPTQPAAKSTTAPLPPGTPTVKDAARDAAKTGPAEAPSDLLLIDLNAPEGPGMVVGENDQIMSENLALMATLEPWDPTDVVADDGTVSMSLATVRLLARTLFQLFIGTGRLRDMTASKLDATAEGVKQGILEYMTKEAMEQGHSEAVIAEIKEKISDYIGLEITRRLAAEESEAQEGGPRQYSAAEMLDLRDRAVTPPGLTAALSGLSILKDNTQVQEPPKASPQVIKPVPNQTSGRTTASSNGNKDTGLRSSRWATGDMQIKHKNYFTGPAYEQEWASRNSQELAEWYFPTPETTEPGVTGHEASVKGKPPAATATPGKAKMDALSAGMSRLSISPSPEQRVIDNPQPTTPQPRVRGLASSRHSAGTGPSSSGAFNFHMPKSALRK
jgi:hypothetical protein